MQYIKIAEIQICLQYRYFGDDKFIADTIRDITNSPRFRLSPLSTSRRHQKFQLYSKPPCLIFNRGCKASLIEIEHSHK